MTPETAQAQFRRDRGSGLIGVKVVVMACVLVVMACVQTYYDYHQMQMLRHMDLG